MLAAMSMLHTCHCENMLKQAQLCSIELRSIQCTPLKLDIYFCHLSETPYADHNSENHWRIANDTIQQCTNQN